MLRTLAVAGVVAALLAACGHDADGDAQPPSAAATTASTTAATPPPAAPSTEAAPPAPPSPADLEKPAMLTVADVAVVLGQHDWCYTSGDTLACEAAGALDGCASPTDAQVDAGQANVLTFPVQPDHVTVSWTLAGADAPQTLWEGGAEAGPFELPVGTGLLDVYVSGPTFENGYRACLTVRALS